MENKIVGVALWILLVSCIGISFAASKQEMKVLDALKKVKASTEIGASREQYFDLVIEAEAALNKLTKDPTDFEKSFLKSADLCVQTYFSAAYFWAKMSQVSDPDRAEICRDEMKKNWEMAEYFLNEAEKEVND